MGRRHIMKQRILWIVVAWLVGLPLAAQSSSEAERLFNAGEYERAEAIYARLEAKSPTNTLYIYRHARCFYEMGRMQEAVELFRRAGSRYALTHFFMGEACMQLWHFEEAEAAYQRYLHTLSAPNERVPHVLAQMNKAAKLQRYMKRVTEVCIVDSTEVLRTDLLSAYHLSAEAGSLTRGDNGTITYTSQRGDRRFTVLTRDTGRVLAYAERLMDTWNEATPLPEMVNRTQEQNYPFSLADGVTLYYAMQDSLGLGGWDIYVSRFNTATNTWTKPENIGFPFNSEANDYLYTEDEKNGVGYFATDRFSDSLHVRVYTFLLPEQKQVLRNLEQDTLVRYARLEAYCIAERPHTGTPTAKVHHPIVEDELTPLEKAEHQLENLRRQYADGDDNLRRQLRPAILALEHTIDSLYHEQTKPTYHSAQ